MALIHYELPHLMIKRNNVLEVGIRKNGLGIVGVKKHSTKGIL
jgi:hypothetical protein